MAQNFICIIILFIGTVREQRAWNSCSATAENRICSQSCTTLWVTVIVEVIVFRYNPSLEARWLVLIFIGINALFDNLMICKCVAEVTVCVCMIKNNIMHNIFRIFRSSLSSLASQGSRSFRPIGEKMFLVLYISWCIITGMSRGWSAFDWKAIVIVLNIAVVSERSLYVIARPFVCLSACLSLPSARQHPSYGDCLEVKREYYQNCSVLGCVTQCSQSVAHLCEQFLQVQPIRFVILGPLRHA